MPVRSCGVRVKPPLSVRRLGHTLLPLATRTASGAVEIECADCGATAIRSGGSWEGDAACVPCAEQQKLGYSPIMTNAERNEMWEAIRYARTVDEDWPTDGMPGIKNATGIPVARPSRKH